MFVQQSINIYLYSTKLWQISRHCPLLFFLCFFILALRPCILHENSTSPHFATATGENKLQFSSRRACAEPGSCWTAIFLNRVWGLCAQRDGEAGRRDCDNCMDAQIIHLSFSYPFLLNRNWRIASSDEALFVRADILIF